jgi:hypothetical protein
MFAAVDNITRWTFSSAPVTAAIERIRFAVLKLSAGDPSALQRAIDLGKIDWRDVLVAAGFDNDVTGYNS